MPQGKPADEKNLAERCAALTEQLHAYEEIIDMFSTTVVGGVAKMNVSTMQILTATEGYYRMTGYTEAESHFPPFSNCGLNLVIPEDAAVIQAALALLLRENKPIRVDYRIRKKDGSIAWNTAFSPSVQMTGDGPVIDVFFLDTTEEKTTALQLSSLLDNLTSGLVRMRVGATSELLYANSEFYRQIGYSRAEFEAFSPENNYLEIICPEDRIQFLDAAHSALHEESGRSSVRFRIVCRTGETRWIRANFSRLYEAILSENILQCILTDITQAHEQEQQILLNEERFRIISEQTRDVVFDWDVATDAIHYSPVYEKMFGVPPPADAVSSGALLSDSIIFEDDKPLIADMIDRMRADTSYMECKVRLRAGDGSYFWTLHRVTAIRNADGRNSHVVGIISDVNDLVENALQMQRKADHDPLTGLLNRAAAETAIERVLKNTENERHAFILLDIDRFKQINDLCGHAAGDLALQKVADCMCAAFRESDVLIRMGGDEFAVFLVNSGNQEQVERRVLEFLHTASADFEFEGKTCPLRVSIGLAFCPADGCDFHTLYEHADFAMYNAKHDGGGRCCRFDASMVLCDLP